MKIRLLGIDSNYRTKQVQAFVRRNSMVNDRVRAFRGDQSVRRDELFRPKKLDRNAKGEIYEGGLEQWGIATTHYKEELVQLYDRDQKQDGAFHMPKDVFVGDGEDMLRQMVNESPQIDRREGHREKALWKVIDGAVGNHYWDDSIYEAAAADMVVGTDGWELSTWAVTVQSEEDPLEESMRDRAAYENEIQAR